MLYDVTVHCNFKRAFRVCGDSDFLENALDQDHDSGNLYSAAVLPAHAPMNMSAKRIALESDGHVSKFAVA